MRSATQLNRKGLNPLIKKSAELMRGNELRSLIKKVSKSKPLMSLLFAAGGVGSLTQMNIIPNNGPHSDIYNFMHPDENKIMRVEEIEGFKGRRIDEEGKGRVVYQDPEDKIEKPASPSELSPGEVVKEIEGMQITHLDKSDAIGEGQMKAFVVGEDQANDTVIVARVEGKLYSVSSKCAHYGVPLIMGMLVGDRLYCPAHMASFSVIDGTPDGGPAFDGLKTFKVWEEKGVISVQAPLKIVHKETMSMAFRDYNN